MLAQRFQQLDQLLIRHRRWWQYQPYHHLTMPFANEAPELVAQLDALTLEQLAELDGDMAALGSLLSPWIADGEVLL